MNKTDMKYCMQKFTESRQGLNSIYEEYAKSNGLSYNSLLVLTIIHARQESCTQKSICQSTLLAKQTVNAITKAFRSQGIIELLEMDSDRRNKTIRMTKEGREYSDKIILKMQNAEERTMEKFDEDQRAALAESIRIYKDHFKEYLFRS